MLKLTAMKSMSFTVFNYTYNATVLVIQPNPRMDPTHVHLWFHTQTLLRVCSRSCSRVIVAC